MSPGRERVGRAAERRAARGRDMSPTGWGRGEGGQVAVLLVALLPLALFLLGLVADIGLALWAREELRQAADLGALAGAQDLDLARLAQGERVLRPDAARADADRYARVNLAGRGYRSLRVEVAVLNATREAPRREPWTGREVRDPTVAVHIEAEIPTVFLRAIVPALAVRATADASVLAHP